MTNTDTQRLLKKTLNLIRLMNRLQNNPIIAATTKAAPRNMMNAISSPSRSSTKQLVHDRSLSIANKTR